MIHIRPYENDDFEMIRQWWIDYDEIPPSPGMMCEDGTFVLEWNEEPLLSLTVLRTQNLEMSYFEGYISRPGLEANLREELGFALWNYCFTYLKKHGYKRVICFTDKPKLVKRYEEFGMGVTMSGLTAMVREI